MWLRIPSINGVLPVWQVGSVLVGSVLVSCHSWRNKLRVIHKF